MARSEKPPKPPKVAAPRHTDRTVAEKAAREARLAQEMRANLLKRKAQQRARRERDKAADS